VLQAGCVLTGAGLVRPGFVTGSQGDIAEIEEGRHPDPDRDFGDGMIVPGFIDLQINGAAGCDFLLPTDEGLEAAHAHLIATGTVAYLPTLISAPEERLRAALAFFATRMRDAGPPRILGVHLEGPFLSPARPGAHPPEHLRRPSVEWLSGLMADFPGLIRIVTLAPELEGALPLVDYLVAQGIVVAVGHTDATYAEAAAAFDRGARLATHLFNAMRPYHHREPGVAGAALAHGDVMCSVIADLVHLHPAVVDQVVALKGIEMTVLVTDAISAAGGEGSEFTLGGRRVRVIDGAPRLEDGTLAGSVLAMDQAVRNVAARSGQWECAVRMASTTPARLLGVQGGELRPGRGADFVVLSRDLAVSAVVSGGVLITPEAVGPPIPGPGSSTP
jgi:N-acetylglucosamine-6-phosphate deacetylase